MFFCFFFFKQKTAYEMRISDWSSDVCSSDLLYGFRHQGRRGDHADLRAQGRKADDVGACHATMQHIAAYRDYQSLDRPLAPSDGERVAQCLCRMFVPSIAGIQHRAIDLVGDQLHGARTLVPDDDHVSAHGVQSHSRIRSAEQTAELQSRMRI